MPRQIGVCLRCLPIRTAVPYGNVAGKPAVRHSRREARRTAQPSRSPPYGTAVANVPRQSMAIPMGAS
ncbi:hypothetical protein [Sinosporangium siamense]|uniref:hypothetical protein n=1 Tax=Sinosporangium siamense TaxID=1367973 RepID=UPI001951A726|nr:hypothetical protein [Sinosporangium siamense]